MDILLIVLADIQRDARTLNMARTLRDAGLKVGVVAAGRLPDAEAGSGVTFIEWADPGGRAFLRMRSLREFLLCNVAVLLDECPPKALYAMDFFVLSATVGLGKQLRVPVAYDMREFMFSLGPLEGKGIKQLFITWSERRLLTRVKAISVSGTADSTIVSKRFKLKSEPTVILNTPPYRDRVEHSSLLRERFSIPSAAFVIVYQGVVHHGRGLAPMMRALVEMPDVHLCIVGDGPFRSPLEDIAVQTRVADRVHWLGSVPYDELHAWTCSADAGCCLIEPVSMSYEYALPNKLFEYMMARIPSLVTDLPALHDHVMRYPVGMLVDRTLSVGAITEAVRRMRVPATYDGFVEQCKVARELSYENQAHHVIDMVSRLTEKGRDHAIRNR